MHAFKKANSKSMVIDYGTLESFFAIICKNIHKSLEFYVVETSKLEGHICY
jgi:hypothetical protein